MNYDLSDLDYPVEVLKAYGIEVARPYFLKLAMVHASYVNENPQAELESNERLEFLGDAILDCIVSEWLFFSCPGRSEGELTKIRASLVCKSTLARWARLLDLGKWLYMGRGEASSGGRERPSILAGAFEAFVAGIYIDAGMDAARSLVTALASEEIRALKERKPVLDPKSSLLELVGRRRALASGKTPSVVFRVVKEAGPQHDKRFEVEVTVDGIGGKTLVARGSGRSRREAERAASLAALSELERS
ncbi:MAG TPA: ribonuclease III [Clostridia bacterium]|nr:ribonuclease III [Clostridia bacterium]